MAPDAGDGPSDGPTLAPAKPNRRLLGRLDRILSLKNSAVVKSGFIVGKKAESDGANDGRRKSGKDGKDDEDNLLKAAHEMKRMEREAAVLSKHADDRSADDIDTILGILMRAKAKILMDLPPEKQYMLAQKVTLDTPLKEGEMLWEEGDPGDSYYVILSGVVNILKWDQVREENVVVATLKKGSGFGEVALRSPDSKRAAGVLCETDCTFVRITAADYSSVVDGEGAEKVAQRVAYLQGLNLFKGLPSSSLTALALVLREKTVPHNTVIVREGGEAEDFYFIVRGSVRVVKCIKCSIDEDLIDQSPRPALGRTGSGDPWDAAGSTSGSGASPRSMRMGASTPRGSVRLPGIGEAARSPRPAKDPGPRRRGLGSRPSSFVNPRARANFDGAAGAGDLSASPSAPSGGKTAMPSPRQGLRANTFHNDGGSPGDLMSPSPPIPKAGSLEHMSPAGEPLDEGGEGAAAAYPRPSPRPARLRGKSMDEIMDPSRMGGLKSKSFDLPGAGGSTTSELSSSPWRVKKEKSAPRKRLVEVATLAQGASFGEVGLLRTGTYGSSVISMGQCTLLSVTKFDVHRRLSPHILQGLWNQSAKSVAFNTNIETQLEESLKWEKYKAELVDRARQGK